MFVDVRARSSLSQCLKELDEHENVHGATGNFFSSRWPVNQSRYSTF